MRFELTRDREEFAARAEQFLAAAIERNVMATVLVTLRTRARSMSPLFALGLDEHGELQAVAMRTPPFALLASELEPGAARELIAAWLLEDPELPAVNAEPHTARAVAAAWAEATGGRARVRMSEAMHVLTEVTEPSRPAPGELRIPADGERDLLSGWFRDFIIEAGVDGADHAAESVERHLAGGTLLVWDDGGVATSLVARSVTVAGVARLGPVYTPPELRTRRYAPSAVAAVSRRALAGDADRCMLFTDLANPTSNKIYAEVGYRRVGEWEDHALEHPA